MKWTHSSILYASLFGASFDSTDLLQISNLIDHDADEIFKQLRSELRLHLEKISWRTKWSEFLEDQDRGQFKYCDFYSENYPRIFRSLLKPPLFISYLGEPIWNQSRCLSVVGSRTPARESLEWMSYHLPPILRRHRMIVVSGGARGVDQWAHQISNLIYGTLCVLPSGLLECYPDSLKPRIQDFVGNLGGVMSTYPPRQEMRKFFFHQRNHLIAALGEALVVVEASPRSGSMVTAKQAGDLGKDIYCLPFSPWQGRGGGNNELIKSGAQLLVEGRDLEEGLRFLWP
ncbi:MAG TPA: hypothetical protein DCL41_06220 [Bdellovibrionales bacterium]|nr:hypothetical protein [Pseudobdellovibrionaceae bacterium]HAG91445.1 hypothetical protein [Bdellovibrionales bacterium]|tara:strand:+ start:549 stop:1409 length:861 start_codon:yes stop_codon:yes gene_type:complete